MRWSLTNRPRIHPSSRTNQSMQPVKFTSKSMMISMMMMWDFFHLLALHIPFPVCIHTYLQVDVELQRCSILCLLGINYCDTEEISEGEQTLTKAETMLGDSLASEKNILVLQGLFEAHAALLCSLLYFLCILAGVFNQLAILWSSRSQYETSAKYLSKAVDAYTSVRKGGSECRPVTMLEHFGFERGDGEKCENGDIVLEQNYTLTIYFQAQVGCS